MPSIPTALTTLLERSASEAIGFGIGTALGRALEPEATTLAQDSWRTDPSLALDAQTWALLYRLGRVELGTAQDHAHATGINDDNLVALANALRSPPSTAELIELGRRHGWADAELELWLERSGQDERLSALIAGLRHQRLAPADIANGVQQGFLSNPGLIAGSPTGGGTLAIDPVAEAADAGLDLERFKLLCELVGLPPGIGEGLELLRRGEIDKARFAEYVAQGHTKTRYTDDLLKLQRTLLSPATWAEALVRERVGETEAVAGAAKWGLEKDDFLLWSNMLGRPISIGEALTLVNREYPGPVGSTASHAFFREVVARSDVRTQYADALYTLRIHYPSLFQMRTLIANQSITDAYAQTILLAEGYPQQLVDGIIAGAHKTRTAGHKTLALSVVETAADAGLTTHAQALAAVESLGYTPADAEELLALHEARLVISELHHGMAIARTRYVGWKIDAAEARAELAALQVSPAVIEQRMAWWAAEREANRPTLTQAQIVAAFHYGRYDYPTTVQLLMARGWSEDDALTLLWDREHGDPRG